MLHTFSDEELAANRLAAHLGISFSEALQMLREDRSDKIEDTYAECPMTGTLEKLPG